MTTLTNIVPNKNLDKITHVAVDIYADRGKTVHLLLKVYTKYNTSRSGAGVSAQYSAAVHIIGESSTSQRFLYSVKSSYVANAAYKYLAERLNDDSTVKYFHVSGKIKASSRLYAQLSRMQLHAIYTQNDDGTTFVRAAEIESRVRAEYPNTKGIKFTKV